MHRAAAAVVVGVPLDQMAQTLRPRGEERAGPMMTPALRAARVPRPRPMPAPARARQDIARLAAAAEHKHQAIKPGLPAVRARNGIPPMARAAAAGRVLMRHL